MFHRPPRSGLLAAALLALCAGPLAAQTSSEATSPEAASSEATSSEAAPSDAAARAAESCTSSHGDGQLAAVLCPPGLEQAVWAEAGRAACEGHELCAAWIYDDPAAQPDPIPKTFEELTQENVTSAVAVWVAEDELLVTIAPTAADSTAADPATADSTAATPTKAPE